MSMRAFNTPIGSRRIRKCTVNIMIEISRTGKFEVKQLLKDKSIVMHLWGVGKWLYCLVENAGRRPAGGSLHHWSLWEQFFFEGKQSRYSRRGWCRCVHARRIHAFFPMKWQWTLNCNVLVEGTRLCGGSGGGDGGGREGRGFVQEKWWRGIAREIVNKSKNGWTRGVRLIKHVHFVH